jgi:hypothetical protein
MRTLLVEGTICLDDDCNITYKIADVKYEEDEEGKFRYTFIPCYSVIELLSSDLFQGIPGLNLDLKKEKYIRENIVPVFISERSPSENREDLQELLTSCGMTHLNRLEWLIKTNTQYFGDRLYVREKIDSNVVIETGSMFNLVERYDSLNKKILDIICIGNNISCSEIKINDSNRLEYYKFLMPIYKKQYEAKVRTLLKSVRKAVENSSFKGRKKIELDKEFFIKVAEDYNKKIISLNEALKKLNISKSTFFRRLKQCDFNK